VGSLCSSMDLYKQAGVIIDKIRQSKGTVKQLVYGSAFPNKKILLALVSQTLRFSSLLDQILSQNPSFVLNHKKLGTGQQWALVHDMLLAGGIKGGGRLKKSITSYYPILNSSLIQLKHKANVTTFEELVSSESKLSASIPRYVRVNTLLSSVADIQNEFSNEGYVLLEKPGDPFLGKQFAPDELLNDLLVFPSSSDFHTHPLLKSGKIVLQDKASCFPAFVLSQCLREYYTLNSESSFPPNCHVIDACAAPGSQN
jgi:25S rRNA (cytosine2278-C5)-methyltransferase